MTDYPRTLALPYLTQSTGLLTESQALATGSGVLVDLLVYTDGANNATVIVYDNPTEADGTELSKIVVKGSDLMGGEVNIFTHATTGLYLSISGTGAVALARTVIPT